MHTTTEKELIQNYSRTLRALRDRGIIRTKNVVGELGERYAEITFSERDDLPTIKLVSTNERDIDARDVKGRGYSIKTVTETSAVRTGAIHLEQDHLREDERFDALVVVILSDSMELRNMYTFTWDQFWQLKSWSKTQKAWFMSLTKGNLSVGTKIV
jgi:hypothetical protein